MAAQAAIGREGRCWYGNDALNSLSEALEVRLALVEAGPNTFTEASHHTVKLSSTVRWVWSLVLAMMSNND